MRNTLDTLWRDVCFGARILGRKPGFTVVIVLTLALGIGANTAIFSILHALFFQPLPYPDSDRLVAVTEVKENDPESYWGVSRPTFRDWKERSRSFDGLSIFVWGYQRSLSGLEQSGRLNGRFVGPAYFDLLGARACRGRLLSSQDFEPGTEDVIVISHGAWQRIFSGDPDIVGRTAILDGRPRVIIGVVGPEFRPLADSEIDFWRQWRLIGENRKYRYFSGIGRLKEGTSIEAAQAEMNAIQRGLAAEHPDTLKGFGVRLVPLQQYLYANFGKRMLVYFIAVVFVLLIACMNVANLMMVRAVVRKREMAVRSSLGAGRRRLIRQLLTESVLLTLLGAAAGIFVAYVGLRLIVDLSPYGIPRSQDIQINLEVLCFTAFVAVLTGLLSGLFPALGASKPNLNEALKETGRTAKASLGGRRGFGTLAVAEVALSLILLIGAGLMLENIRRVLTVDIGFDSENLMTMRMALPNAPYLDDSVPARKVLSPRAALVRRRIREQLQSVPGVALVSLTDFSAPLQGCGGRVVTPATRDTAPEDNLSVCYQPISPDYFETLQVSLVRGRFFTGMDAENAPKVAIINESLAAREFPSEDPIGQELIIGRRDAKDRERSRIVGIVKDFRQSALRMPMPALYVPYEQIPTIFNEPDSTRLNLSFVIRTKTAPSGLGPALRKAAAEAASDVPVVGIQTVEEIRSASLSNSRYYSWLLAVFAGIAVVLATAGLFGVISYSVARRTKEIGLRIALGAKRRDVLCLVMKQGLIMTLAGLAIGIGGALWLTRFLESQLYEVKPTDPATFAAASSLLALVSLLACLLPARKAMKVEPMVALRHE